MNHLKQKETFWTRSLEENMASENTPEKPKLPKTSQNWRTHLEVADRISYLLGLISAVLMLGWRRTNMVSPNDPTLVVPSKPCQSALTRKKLVSIYIKRSDKN